MGMTQFQTNKWGLKQPLNGYSLDEDKSLERSKLLNDSRRRGQLELLDNHIVLEVWPFTHAVARAFDLQS